MDPQASSPTSNRWLCRNKGCGAELREDNETGLCRACEDKARILARLKKARNQMPVLFSETRFGDIDRAESRSLEQYCSLPNRDEWLYLWGPPRTGKTSLAAACYLALAPRYTTADWCNCARLMMDMRDAIRSQRNEWSVLKAWIEPQLLVLDDIGTELSTDYAEQCLYVLLNERWERKLRTIITGNETLMTLATQKHCRIADRIARASIVVEFKPDRYSEAKPKRLNP